MSKKPSLVIAGGGTGGHVLAGIAVADAWRARFGADAPVTFVGAQGGIEERLVPKAGYPLRLLKVGALNRVSLARRLKTFLQLPVSFLTSWRFLRESRPVAVLGVGGYASGPLVLVARLATGAQTAILEQNSVAGFTNRVLGRIVHWVFCAFPGTRAFGDRKVKTTGNPVRAQMVRMPAAPIEPFTIFIFGGSQGAQGINTLILDTVAELGADAKAIRWIHQTGEKDYARVHEGYKKMGVEARVEKFIDDMASCYRTASLVVCRSGSGTLSEVAAVGRAAVLVPFPLASDNHQEHNARVFSDRGAAILMRQAETKGPDLARLVRELRADPSRVRAMETKMAEMFRPGSAQNLVAALAEASRVDA